MPFRLSTGAREYFNKTYLTPLYGTTTEWDLIKNDACKDESVATHSTASKRGYPI